jgi:hypothetical protein
LANRVTRSASVATCDSPRRPMIRSPSQRPGHGPVGDLRRPLADVDHPGDPGPLGPGAAARDAFCPAGASFNRVASSVQPLVGFELTGPPGPPRHLLSTLGHHCERAPEQSPNGSRLSRAAICRADIFSAIPREISSRSTNVKTLPRTPPFDHDHSRSSSECLADRSKPPTDAQVLSAAEELLDLAGRLPPPGRHIRAARAAAQGHGKIAVRVDMLAECGGRSPRPRLATHRQRP